MVWSYPGALFMSAGGYHHHVAVNTWAAGAPNASNDDARLVDWELVVPDSASVQAAAASIATAGFDVDRDGDVMVAADPWGILLRLRSSSASS
jgi:catechol 2,3-dioxygenase